MIAGAAAAAMAWTVSGVVADNEGETLPGASVRLLSACDSSVVKGMAADAMGRFSFDGIKGGRYIVEASYVGYSPSFAAAAVRGADMKLDTLRLASDAIMLRETEVVGIKTPVTVKEDTVEFNATAYRTQPNAPVQDLLKRLPGVEVGSDGSITANGKSVTKILVDGKEFFSDDPTVASRNIPADMVDRLQVVNRKSDLARITGVDDGEEETVINLTVKKGMQNGWFGTVEGGYGSADRYRGQFNINRFFNGNQITLIGAANNVNDLSFNDGNAGRFRRFGGTTGVTTSQALGVNFNVGRGDSLRVGGDVMWSRSDRATYQRSARQYLTPGESPYSSSIKDARDLGNNLRADFRLEWKPDSLNTIDFRPRMSYNHNNSSSYESGTTSRNAGGQDPITRSNNSDNSQGNSWEAAGSLIINHRFASRPGRSVSLSADYRFSNVTELSNTYSWNQFLLNDSLDIVNQLDDSRTLTNEVKTRLTWTEPLGKPSRGNFLTFAYRLQYRRSSADKLIYDRDNTDGVESLTQNNDLSTQFRNTAFNQDIRLGFKHVDKRNTLDAGISAVPQRSMSVDLINHDRDISRSVFNIAPFLRYRLKLSKVRSLSADYRGRSNQPTMAQLQPVPDMSNPMSIVIGNMGLKPEFNHFINVRYSDFNAAQQRSVMTMIMSQVTQNSIVSKTTLDPSTMVRTTEYTNVNGLWNIRAMNMISFPFRNKKWTFNNHLMAYYAKTAGYTNGVFNRAHNVSFNIRPGIAFRPDNFEFELRPSYSLQSVTNTMQPGSDRLVHNYGSQVYVSYTLPFGLTANTELGYTASSGYSSGYEENRWLWNANLSYQMLRSRNLTLSLKAYDLLNQDTNIRRNATALYIDDVATNSLGRYVMLTVAYKFNTFGSGEMPRDRNAEGPGGRRWGGGPPPPPPGH